MEEANTSTRSITSLRIGYRNDKTYKRIRSALKNHIVYDLTAKSMEASLTFKGVPEIYANWSKHNKPIKNYLRVPPDFAGYNGILSLSICINKVEEEEEEEFGPVIYRRRRRALSVQPSQRPVRSWVVADDDDDELINKNRSVFIKIDPPDVLDCHIRLHPLFTPVFQLTAKRMKTSLSMQSEPGINTRVVNTDTHKRHYLTIPSDFEGYSGLLSLSVWCSLIPAYWIARFVTSPMSTLTGAIKYPVIQDSTLSIVRMAISHAACAAPRLRQSVLSAIHLVINIPVAEHGFDFAVWDGPSSVLPVLLRVERRNASLVAKRQCLAITRVSMNNHAHMLHAGALTLHAHLLDLSKASTSTLTSSTQLPQPTSPMAPSSLFV
ncbi:hypothetical protein Tco_0657572 [Tanacetum coccineum]